MGRFQLTGTRRHRRVLVPVAIVTAGVAAASVAWACVPILPSDPSPPPADIRTLIQSCVPPSGATKPCKPMLNTPPFPEATAVKGPRESTLVAYVKRGLQPGLYDLVFSDSAELASGDFCHEPPLRVIAGPIPTNGQHGLSLTSAKIPADAQLGGGQLCFVSRATGSSLPARFKVTI